MSTCSSGGLACAEGASDRVVGRGMTCLRLVSYEWLISKVPSWTLEVLNGTRRLISNLEFFFSKVHRSIVSLHQLYVLLINQFELTKVIEMC